MSAVSLDDVRKVYGSDTVALDGVSLDVDPGEFVVLLGPSGAGKSTLLRALNGLTAPTSGQIAVHGDPPAEAGSDVGMVFQEHNLVPSMSAVRNAATGALARTSLPRSALGAYPADVERAALSALDTVGLLDAAGQRAGSMSGGQKQRVGVARALVQDPDVLLADEPVASLDPRAAREVMRYLHTAAGERDLTTVVSLHQINIAREFGERFVGLRDGAVVFDGPREDLTMDAVDAIYYGEEGRDDDPDPPVATLGGETA